MKLAHVALGIFALAGLATGCDQDRDGGEAEPADETKKKRKKKGEGTSPSGTAAPETLDLTKLHGEEPAFGGSLDVFGELTFGDIPGDHQSVEPSQFSDGWVGREAYNVLQRARKGEFPHKQVRTADGRVCLVFTENNIVRRAMLVRSATSPSEELAFSAAGGLIFWYANNRKKPLFEEWAYFFRNASMQRYDVKQEGRAREIDTTPGPQKFNDIISGARQCVQAAGAANPTPGTRLEPPPPPPAPSRAYHGAVAVSTTTDAWRIAYNYGTEAEARSHALAACSPSCTVRNVFGTGQCMSMVHGPGKYLSWSWGADNNSTAASAKQACEKEGHPSDQCAVQGTWCNNRADGTGAPPAPSPPPTPTPPPPPAPASTFTKVDTSVWQPRLGPKMKAGSTVVHDVFEGPFGPSPRSLFAVTRRPDDTFWIYVMGDDGKSWPAGPCAEPGLDLAHKIVAVSFFDADGDGSLDALVMATYHDHRGHGPYHKNILLKWTSLGLRRLLHLEPKIKNLDSVAAIRRTLGRA